MPNGVWSLRESTFINSAATNPDRILSHRLTSRFFLNLRSINAREQSISETRTVPPVLRTRSGRRRAIQTMTSYIGSEMDESILSYIATPNERDVQLAEIVDLEVMESQAHHDGDEHDLGSKRTLTFINSASMDPCIPCSS